MQGFGGWAMAFPSASNVRPEFPVRWLIPAQIMTAWPWHWKLEERHG